MKLGDIVIVEFHPELDGRAFNGGERRAPAIVNRVWNDDMINVTIFGDFELPQTLTSVGRLREGEGFSSSYAFYEPDSAVAVLRDADRDTQAA